MSQWLKVSTAITLIMGPFLDKTDGVTEETALSPAVEVSKNGGAFGARSSADAIAHDQNGWYTVPLNTTDTGTLGRLVVKSDSAADHLPVWHEFMVVPAKVYDSLIGGSDNLEIDLILWKGSAPNNLVSGRVDAQVGGQAPGVVQDANIVQIDGQALSKVPSFGQSIARILKLSK